MRWMNEPRWSLGAHGMDTQSLRVQTDDHTDFWRESHYGFVRDSGHFLHINRMHDFTAQVRVEGQYQARYDQAGLMVRSGPETWVKAGVEFVGEQQVSAVVTREFSDWNVRPVGLPDYIDLKLTRRGNALSVQVQLPATAGGCSGWPTIRRNCLRRWASTPAAQSGPDSRCGFHRFSSDHRTQARCTELHEN